MADLLPSAPDTSAVDEADPRVIGVNSDDAADLLGALSSETARELLAALHDDPANAAKLAEEVDTTIQNAQYHLEKLEAAGLIEVIDTVYSEKGREMRVYAPSDRPLVVVAGGDEETSTLKAALSRLLGGFSALAVSSVVIQELLGGGVERVVDALPDPPGLPVSLGEDLQSGEPADDASEPTPEDLDNVSGPASGETATPDSASDATPTPEATGTPMPDETPTPDGTSAPDATPTPEATETPTAMDTPTPEPQATGTPEATGTPTSTPMDTLTPTETPVPEMAPQAADQLATVPPGLVFFAGGATILLGAFVLWHLGWL